jgi:hypothetical protein
MHHIKFGEFGFLPYHSLTKLFQTAIDELRPESFGRSPQTHHPASMFHTALDFSFGTTRARGDDSAALRSRYRISRVSVISLESGLVPMS